MKLTGQPLEPRRRTPPRPYARKRGGPPSVTTVLDAMGGKSGMPFAAANETAEFLLDYPEKLAGLSRDEAYDRARRHFRGVWDGRAAMGTLIHEVNEAWTWGEVADIEALVHEAANRDKRAVKIWQGREDFIVAEAAGYVDGLEKFWNDYSPVTIATEEVVRHPDGANAYIGQRDWVAELEGLPGRTLIDIKTTAQQDAEKGYYLESWRLQLAAYKFADEIVEYDADGTEVATHPNYAVARCCVIHLRGQGDYELLEVQAGGMEHNRFLQIVGIHHWITRESRKPDAVVLNVPGLKESVGAA